MSIINLVSFCDEEYHNSTCEKCTQNCTNECELNCVNCLDDIHYHHNNLRNDYCCERLMDCYVCRYEYKYCSEIMYALENLDLSNYPYFNILSLGCGGAPDLYAFLENNDGKEINYYGFDNNESWAKIHNFIQRDVKSTFTEFNRNIDVLEYFSRNYVENFNVLVIQYLISHFYNELGEMNIRKWFGDLIENIVKYKPDNSPILIIINDADSYYTGRDTFPVLTEELKSKGYSINYERRMRFKDNDYFEGSKKYHKKCNKFNVPDNFSEDYHVALNCESVQLIVEVK